MNYYSTNNRNNKVTLREAVIQGLAPDNGLYMPELIPALSPEFIASITSKTFPEIARTVAVQLLGEDVPHDELSRIVDHTISFDAPLVEIENDTFALELFHGPTLAFKDFGARFMSQLLGYFASQEDKMITILAATSGDTGSAVANGFLGVEGTRVVVLYPSGKVSDIQEKQFTTLGENVTALEVEGTFDDCQRLVKQAFLDTRLKRELFLTSANSINIARLIPQSFYYFYAYAQLPDKSKPVVVSVPSGNFGNLTAGVIAKKMGLPIERFIAATNMNDVVPQYLRTTSFDPRPSRQTISNAMDVGNPSNFARLMDLFAGDHPRISEVIRGYAFTDSETAAAMRALYQTKHYVLDPHGAVGYLGLKKFQAESPGRFSGIFLETAHPAKFKEVVDSILPAQVDIPASLMKFINRKKHAIRIPADFNALEKQLLASQ